MIPRWKDTDPDVLEEALAAVNAELERLDQDDEIANEAEDTERERYAPRDPDVRA